MLDQTQRILHDELAIAALVVALSSFILEMDIDVLLECFYVRCEEVASALHALKAGIQAVVLQHSPDNFFRLGVQFVHPGTKQCR